MYKEASMKTVILYATKHGAAQTVAERIANKLDSAALHNLAKPNIPNLAEYDCVIIGSSIYAGSIRKEAKAYIKQNAAVLQDKSVGLFLSGLRPAEADKVFAENFPPQLVQSAITNALLGGIFDPEKCNKFERFLMKTVAKHKSYISTINDDDIAIFTRNLTTC